MFPNELIPDGNVMAPHHFYYFSLLALIFIAALWDNYREKEPIAVSLLVVSGLFGFLFVWPRYPETGAIISIVAPVLAIVLIIIGHAMWHKYPWKYKAAIIISLLFALDDSIDHAFDFATPLDYVWNNGLREYNLYVVLLVGATLLAYVVYSMWKSHA